MCGKYRELGGCVVSAVCGKEVGGVCRFVLSLVLSQSGEGQVLPTWNVMANCDSIK
jgi:hypothetical protein